jgi:radical SAM superfamily enzyme YgiQ (UPF0313 family)
MVQKNVLLITVSSPEIKQIRRARYIGFQQCTMPYLAAFFPKTWQVTHVDEECENVDYDASYDLVGLTFHTPCAHHAYAIAERFRAQDTPVIMGGPHVTLVPDEAQQHATAIFIGEAEKTLPQFIADFEHGVIKRRYECGEPPSLSGLPFSVKELFHRSDHTAGILIATRGCPNSCAFCTIYKIYGQCFRMRPVDEVAREFGSFRGKVIVFWDDNIAADLAYGKELFRALTPHKKWWTAQASIAVGYDDEWLELAAKSGCKHLFIGFESILQQSLNREGKAFNRVDEYLRVIENIHAHGIGVQPGIVFGFDEDTPDVFMRTVDFLEAAGVQNATFNMLTPYPGTVLFERLEQEGRILTYDWSQYDSRTHVVFQPANMSREELLAGFNAVNRRFYTARSIWRRLSKSPVGLYWTLPLNLIYLYLFARKISSSSGNL